MSIPIRNLYYLLLYAYDAFDEGDVVEADALPETGIADLFAHVLDTGVNRLLRRGLDRGYVAVREAIPGVRGRIDVSTTVKTNTRVAARTVCEFDEMTADVTHNRILRSTARRLMRARDLDTALHDRLARLYRRMDGVGDLRLTGGVFRSIQLHRNNRFYRFLFAVCRMVHHHLLVDEATGQAHFRRFERDEPRMRRLFERFVRNFFRREQTAFRVGARRVTWSATGDTAILPGMQTDVTLKGSKRLIVVETKYTANQVQSRYGGSTARSDHLYQLFAYLMNIAKSHPQRQAEGVLLYPHVGGGVQGRVTVHGMPLRIATLDLNRRWEEIREELLSLLD